MAGFKPKDFFTDESVADAFIKGRSLKLAEERVAQESFNSYLNNFQALKKNVGVDTANAFARQEFENNIYIRKYLESAPQAQESMGVEGDIESLDITYARNLDDPRQDPRGQRFLNFGAQSGSTNEADYTIVPYGKKHRVRTVVDPNTGEMQLVSARAVEEDRLKEAQIRTLRGGGKRAATPREKAIQSRITEGKKTLGQLQKELVAAKGKDKVTKIINQQMKDVQDDMNTDIAALKMLEEGRGGGAGLRPGASQRRKKEEEKAEAAEKARRQKGIQKARDEEQQEVSTMKTKENRDLYNLVLKADPQNLGGMTAQKISGMTGTQKRELNKKSRAKIKLMESMQSEIPGSLRTGVR